MNKLLDLRFVIGLFFLVVGMLLLGYSFVSENKARNMTEVNRWCGIVFILFGVFMNLLRKSADKVNDKLT
jgi:hypothetical protein